MNLHSPHDRALILNLVRHLSDHALRVELRLQEILQHLAYPPRRGVAVETLQALRYVPEVYLNNKLISNRFYFSSTLYINILQALRYVYDRHFS